MKHVFFLSGLFIIISCDTRPPQAYVPDSSGQINHLTVVMPKSSWRGDLGAVVSNHIATTYEGLPLDEPRFTLRYLEPEAFTGFGRHGRNVLWFLKDSINRFQLVQNQFARPQILGLVRGEDDEVMVEYIKENANLLIASFHENERKEKIRRIKKSETKDTTFETKYGIALSYPTAYRIVKDTTNFLWIEKPIQKGTMNIIAYVISENTFNPPSLERLVQIRDSIGQRCIPGRLPNTHMITEAAYKPYFYKTKLGGQKAYLTKGMWEVKRDFMAGPFINYMVEDKNKKRWIAIEGFAFAPSVSKRDYMFELSSILSTLEFSQAQKN